LGVGPQAQLSEEAQMRDFAVIVAQIVISLLVTGAVFPLLMLQVPSLHDHRVGPLLMYACPVAVFLVLRALWRRAEP